MQATRHAIQRFRERVEPLPPREVADLLAGWISGHQQAALGPVWEFSVVWRGRRVVVIVDHGVAVTVW